MICETSGGLKPGFFKKPGFYAFSNASESDKREFWLGTALLGAGEINKYRWQPVVRWHRLAALRAFV
jgi:hypothetical protein